MTLYFFKFYITAFITFIVIDFVWLNFIAKAFYQKHIGFLFKTSFEIPTALLLYALLIAGLVIFVLLPLQSEKSLWKVLLYAAFYGLCTYGTYDLTNQATIKNWPLIITIVDIAWGMSICMITAAVARSVKLF